MTRADVVLALLAKANPVSDPTALTVDTEVGARLESVEHRSETMQETNVQSIARPEEESSRRRLFAMVGAAAAALAVGLAGFAFFRGAGEVAGVEPTLTFDGSTCTYEGRLEFDGGAERLITFVNTSDALTGLGVFKAVDGTAIENVDPADIFMSLEPGGISFVADAPSGGQVVVDATVFAPVADDGDWLLVCFVRDRDATSSTPPGDHPAAIFTVGP